MNQQASRGVLFYSYDPSDNALREQLVPALRQLVREAHLSEWSAQQILAGADIRTERRRGLECATLILLLLSPHYLASDVWYQEMQDALKRQQEGLAHVIPILLRPCDWLATPLVTLSSSTLPSNRQSVISWDKQEEAFFDIVQGIRRSIGLPSTAPPSVVERALREEPSLSSDVVLIDASLDPSESPYEETMENGIKYIRYKNPSSDRKEADNDNH